MGFSSARLKPPSFGSASSRRWTVVASRPVLSARRLAARPVGAQSASLGPSAATIFRMELTSVVLPTPGPPVITRTLEPSARRTASRWLSARVRPVFSSTQGIARSASMAGQGGVPAAKRRSRSAISRSARCRPERNTHRCPSSVSATTSPASSSRPSAVCTRSSGTSSSPRVSAMSCSSGRPQCPSSMASASAKETPARTRIMAVRSMPSFSAMRSAVRKPMPRMSRASR